MEYSKIFVKKPYIGGSYGYRWYYYDTDEEITCLMSKLSSKAKNEAKLLKNLQNLHKSYLIFNDNQSNTIEDKDLNNHDIIIYIDDVNDYNEAGDYTESYKIKISEFLEIVSKIKNDQILDVSYSLYTFNDLSEVMITFEKKFADYINSRYSVKDNIYSLKDKVRIM